MCGRGTIKRRSNEVRGVSVEVGFYRKCGQVGRNEMRWANYGRWNCRIAGVDHEGFEPVSSRYLCAGWSVKRVYTLRAGACDSDSRLCVLVECCKRTE